MSEENTRQPAPEQELSEILQIRRDKLAALQQEGRDPFTKTKFTRTAWSEEIKADYDAFADKTISVAGRIMSKRGMGKAIFCHIKDDRGQTSAPMLSARGSLRTSASTISATLSVFPATCSRQRPRRYLYMCRASSSFRSLCARCRRSSTA